MTAIDADLLSIQEARIRVEEANRAKAVLVDMTQEHLDAVVEAMLDAVEVQAEALAELSVAETGFGSVSDKRLKNLFVCKSLRSRLKGMRCVGVLSQDDRQGTAEIGVPLGVIVAACPVTSPVSTVLFNAVIAIKSGNAVVFSLHPRAQQSMKRVLDLVISAAVSAGLPEGALAYCCHITRAGTQELMDHKDTSLVMVTGVPSLYDLAEKSGKPTIIGGSGGGPAFIERTANISQAVEDIIASRSFDGGMAIAAEQSVVVDRPINDEVREAFIRSGAYFMTDHESALLGEALYCRSGKTNINLVGISAYALARRAGFMVPESTRVLISYQKYVGGDNPYTLEHSCPVLAYYLEDDWQNACEKCIELLLVQGRGHTLVIHSQDKEVIRQFALKKPVGRVLVNTPGVFGGMGATTNLFPSLALGSASAGKGLTAENVSPKHLTYVRMVGSGVRSWETVRKELGGPSVCGNDSDVVPYLTASNSTERRSLEQTMQEILRDTQDLSRR